MKLPFPPLPFIAILLMLVAIPDNTGAGLFDSDKDAAIKRKAKKYNLVAAEDAIPGVYIDLRYSHTSASGRPLYKKGMICLVNRFTAEKLNAAQKILQKQGFALKIWDAFRPQEAHIALWEAVRDPQFVIPPSRGLSWHCYGVSIDVTLVRKNGQPVRMPTGYDEFSARASSNYTGGDPEVAKNLGMLQSAMRQAGFSTIPAEWWHFDDKESRSRVRRATAKTLGIPMP